MYETRLLGAAGRAIVAGLLVLAPHVTWAQTVNPRTLEFNPSADHNAVGSDGTPLVTEYIFSVYIVGQSAPVYSASLGKPAPDPDGVIRVDVSGMLSTLKPSIVYEARVTATG